MFFVPLTLFYRMFRNDDRPSKRQRVDYDEMDDDDERDSRPKRTLASTVVMPSIETKSREEKIEEMNKTEKKEVTTRLVKSRLFHCLMIARNIDIYHLLVTPLFLI
ncbi:unnamed protein product, partial [Angiostrongylus costaricensis]|uniref:G_PROTEIN_RECEP_F1_2 domain-containing protein n=1 Tax=Angiostrongylus costaricensis TaxID=334426 RepID=A0A158PIT3_ANGCS